MVSLQQIIELANLHKCASTIILTNIVVTIVEKHVARELLAELLDSLADIPSHFGNVRTVLGRRVSSALSHHLKSSRSPTSSQMPYFHGCKIAN